MSDTIWKICDEIGPQKVVGIYEPALNLKAAVVIDNTAMGPAIGGVRMAEDVTVTECANLARAMTLKNAASGLPHGGGKAVIVGNPKQDNTNKERLIRAFANAIEELVDYIPGPDMGTNERCMAWVYDEIKRSIGRPVSIGGIPLDEIGATGFGLMISIIAAENFCDVRIKNARLAVQGFGSVGQHVARFLHRQGAILVAAADSSGMVKHPEGLDVDALVAHKRETGCVNGFSNAEMDSADAIIDIECDIWVPAARPEFINKDNVYRLNTRLVAQGANIAVTPEAEGILEQSGVVVLPDFIANAGGVICGSVEYHRGTRADAFKQIEETIKQTTTDMFESMARNQLSSRAAAIGLAGQRLRDAMAYRRWNRP